MLNWSYETGHMLHRLVPGGGGEEGGGEMIKNEGGNVQTFYIQDYLKNV